MTPVANFGAAMPSNVVGAVMRRCLTTVENLE